MEPVLVALPIALIKLPKRNNLRNTGLIFPLQFFFFGWGWSKFASLIKESLGFTANHLYRKWERVQAATCWFARICPSLLLISKVVKEAKMLL